MMRGRIRKVLVDYLRNVLSRSLYTTNGAKVNIWIYIFERMKARVTKLFFCVPERAFCISYRRFLNLYVYWILWLLTIMFLNNPLPHQVLLEFPSLHNSIISVNQTFIAQSGQSKRKRWKVETYPKSHLRNSRSSPLWRLIFPKTLFRRRMRFWVSWVGPMFFGGVGVSSLFLLLLLYLPSLPFCMVVAGEGIDLGKRRRGKVILPSIKQVEYPWYQQRQWRQLSWIHFPRTRELSYFL